MDQEETKERQFSDYNSNFENMADEMVLDIVQDIILTEDSKQSSEPLSEEAEKPLVSENSEEQTEEK